MRRLSAGWSVPLLFAYGKNRFSHDVAQFFSGMDHDVLVKAAEEHFVKKPVWMEEGIEIDRRKTRDNSISQYTGGIVKVFVSFTRIWPVLVKYQFWSHLF